MGTTLTGTTPQDTYDSLIKVTDNGPLSGTLKALSDGLGNDSSLSLSTTAASLSGTLAVTSGLTAATGSFLGSSANGTLRAEIAVEGVASTNTALIAKTSNGLNDVFRWFDGATQLGVFKNSGNVGIGTGSPAAGYKLDVAGRTKAYNAGYIADFVSTESNASSIQLYADNTNVSIVQGGTSAVPLTFFVSGTEKMRIQTGGGISFNGDTAAANALDDYEEGTWTMGVSFGEASVGVTTSTNTGSYTKIGRQVTVNGYLELSSKGSSSGAARITGLPFTIGNSTSNFSAPTLRLANIAFVNQFQGYGEYNATSIRLQETTILGVVTDLTEVEFANNSGIIFCFTYFV